MIEDTQLPATQTIQEESTRLSPAQAREKMINYSDVPELSGAWFESAKRATQLPEKKQVSLRIDEDILDFFKQQGSRYQTKMHAVLRAYVDGHKLLNQK
jgi:uncharacterized protein (DUF4415 family)